MSAASLCQITAKGKALSVPAFKAGSLTNTSSIEGLQEYFNIVAPAIDSDLGLEIMTDHTGCATFPRFRFLDGSNGWVHGVTHTRQVCRGHILNVFVCVCRDPALQCVRDRVQSR